MQQKRRSDGKKRTATKQKNKKTVAEQQTKKTVTQQQDKNKKKVATNPQGSEVARANVHQGQQDDTMNARTDVPDDDHSKTVDSEPKHYDDPEEDEVMTDIVATDESEKEMEKAQEAIMGTEDDMQILDHRWKDGGIRNVCLLCR